MQPSVDPILSMPPWDFGDRSAPKRAPESEGHPVCRKGLRLMGNLGQLLIEAAASLILSSHNFLSRLTQSIVNFCRHGSSWHFRMPMLGEYTLQSKLAPQCCIDYTSHSQTCRLLLSPLPASKRHLFRRISIGQSLKLSAPLSSVLLCLQKGCWELRCMDGSKWG